MIKDKKDQEQMKELADKILYHKALYYRGEPEIDDREFDNLENKLRELDPDNPVLFLVGSNEIKGTVEHKPPMLSCRKATEGISEVYSWFEKVQDKQILASYKVDGLSMSIIFENGFLKLASTRGNGQLGENVTANIMKVDSIPKIIPIKETVNIRGELYMKKSEFNRLKGSMPEMFSSPRNLATGTIKQKNPIDSANRELHLMVFDVIGLNNYTYTSQQLGVISSWGFETVILEILRNPSLQELERVYTELKNKRNDLDFEIDGIVYRWDNRKEFEEAGTTAHSPRGQIALKFENQGTVTTLKGITWQVGRTGVLTPVAELEPVDVAGATISRATMHNYAFVKLNDISIGDLVTVERAGDVIPKITGVTEKIGRFYVPPSKCPYCETDLTENNVTLVCPNEQCSERIKQIIMYWIRVVDIKGLGDKNVEKLMSKGYLKTIGDLYSKKITILSLVSLLGKNGKKIYEEIQNKKVLPLDILLTGLGIEGVGKTTAKVLIKYFPTLNDLQNAKKEDLLKIEGISDISADKIITGIRNNVILEDLLKNGVTVGNLKTVKKSKPSPKLTDFLNLPSTEKDSNAEEEEEEDSTNNSQIPKASKTIQDKRTIEESKGKVYVTGSVANMTKEQIQEFIEQEGYEWSTSVSGKLSYLILGTKPGQAKIDKALKVGIKVISWEKFIQKIKEKENIQTS